MGWDVWVESIFTKTTPWRNSCQLFNIKSCLPCLAFPNQSDPFKRASCVHACNGLLNVNATAEEIPASRGVRRASVFVGCRCGVCVCACAMQMQGVFYERVGSMKRRRREIGRGLGRRRKMAWYVEINSIVFVIIGVVRGRGKRKRGKGMFDVANAPRISHVIVETSIRSSFGVCGGESGVSFEDLLNESRNVQHKPRLFLIELMCVSVGWSTNQAR
jgi:hypothetical protein